MRLAFTGTRQGMTAAQRRRCATLLRELMPEEVHHGDAIGADAEFHDGAAPRCARDGASAARAEASGVLLGRSDRSAEPLQSAESRPGGRGGVVLGAPTGQAALNPGSGTWYTVR